MLLAPRANVLRESLQAILEIKREYYYADPRKQKDLKYPRTTGWLPGVNIIHQVTTPPSAIRRVYTFYGDMKRIKGIVMHSGL